MACAELEEVGIFAGRPVVQDSDRYDIAFAFMGDRLFDVTRHGRVIVSVFPDDHSFIRSDLFSFGWFPVLAVDVLYGVLVDIPRGVVDNLRNHQICNDILDGIGKSLGDKSEITHSSRG